MRGMLRAGVRGRWLLVAAALAAGACGPARPATETARGAVSTGPLIGAELPVDDVVYTQQTGQQYSPFIAAGGQGALIVWTNDPSGGTSAVIPISIDFARIDPQGNFLDPLPVAIGTPTSAVDPASPAAAWNGNQALVVWSAGGASAGDVEVRGSRITPDGTVLDPGTASLPGGISVELGEKYGGGGPSVIPFGDGFMVFWAASDGSPYCNRVGPDGSVPSTAGSLVALPADGVTRSAGGPAPVTGGVLVVVYQYMAGVKVMKVDGNGAALTPLSDWAGAASTNVAGAALASNGGNGAFLCWGEQTAANQPVTIYGRRADATATWVDAAPFQIRAAGGQVGRIGAIWDGTRYICSWTDKGTAARVAFQPVAASGTPLAAATVGPSTLATTAVQSAQLAWTGTDYAVAMTRTEDGRVADNYGGNPDGVLLRMLDANLQPLGTDAVPVTRAPNQQIAPRAAATPDGVYVVYADDRRRDELTMQGAYNQDIYGAFVTMSGGVLTPTVTRLTPNGNPAYDPAVSWNGSQLMLFYATNSDSEEYPQDFVQLAGASGTAAGGQIGPLTVTNTGNEALTLWNGQNFLVATATTSAFYFFRVSPSGVVLDTSTPTPTSHGPQVSLGFEQAVTTLQGVALGDKYLLVGATSHTDSAGSRNRRRRHRRLGRQRRRNHRHHRGGAHRHGDRRAGCPGGGHRRHQRAAGLARPRGCRGQHRRRARRRDAGAARRDGRGDRASVAAVDAGRARRSPGPGAPTPWSGPRGAAARWPSTAACSGQTCIACPAASLRAERDRGHADQGGGRRGGLAAARCRRRRCRGPRRAACCRTRGSTPPRTSTSSGCSLRPVTLGVAPPLPDGGAGGSGAGQRRRRRRRGNERGGRCGWGGDHGGRRGQRRCDRRPWWGRRRIG